MIPYLLAIAGGYLIGSGMRDNAVKYGKGGSIQDKLDNLNTKGLDRYERMVYDDMIMKGRSKTEALMILINQVEGDYSQLSPSLRKIALDMEDEMTGESEGERRMGMDMAKGGRVRFRDKVKAISKRLEGTEVPRRLRKDYGAFYDREESQMAAKRIVGSKMKK